MLCNPPILTRLVVRVAPAPCRTLASAYRHRYLYGMLVLSRKVGERILIGDQIAVTVVRVAPGLVRLGVEAPDDMPIVREEIKDQLKQDGPPPQLNG